MLLTFDLMLLRVLLRRQWLAAAAFVLLGASAAFGDAHSVIRAVGEISFFTLFAANPAPVWRITADDRMPFRGQHCGRFSDRGFLRLVRDHNRLRFGSDTCPDRLRLPRRRGRAPLFKAGFLESD